MLSGLRGGGWRPSGPGAGCAVLTVLVASGQELQIVNMVVVIARGPQNFKRQVSYDWRGSAKQWGQFVREQIPCPSHHGSTSIQRGPVCMFNDQHSGFISQEQGHENNFAMVHTREAVFSKVLKLPGI